MRFAKVASALAIVVCAAVFGVIVLQETFFSGQAPLPARAAPADGQAPTLMRADAPATNALRRPSRMRRWRGRMAARPRGG